jgi:hypothetical protein
LDEFAKQNEVRKLPGGGGVNVAVTWGEGYMSYRGRSHGREEGNKLETRSKASREKSAEAIVDTETSLPQNQTE